MTNLLFFLWMLLYPVLTSIDGYISKISRKRCGIPQLSEEHNSGNNSIELIIYVVVAAILFFTQ